MSKHMTIDDRQTIAIGLKQGESLGAIAKQLGKCSSTISREIRSHRIVLNKNPYGRIVNRCINRNNCNLHSICDSDCKRKCSTCNSCNSRCDLYKEERCEKLSRPPYVCNGCSDLPRCTLEKFYYDPIQAKNEYRQLLIESREGFKISADELRVIDDHITPLILNGQSVYHATLACCNELTVSSRSVYRLIDKSALKARNIDLPRKCKLKPRKGKKPVHKIDAKCRLGRTYDDYLAYIKDNPNVMPAQMDSVVGGSGTSKVLLTLRLQGDFMLAFIRDNNTAKSVLDWIEFLYNGLGHNDFCSLFPVILTDNGSEFSNPSAIESSPNGKPRTKVFYCNPMASWQKPNVEREHELFRRIIPSGSSFDNLTQSDINLVASHVNSYARVGLESKSPIDTLVFLYGEKLALKLLRLLGQTRIEPKNIVLSPALLGR